MPRRKQGHSKECATGAYLKKKIDPAIALIKHESLKHNKLNKDMVYKLKKTTSKSLSASDEKNAREHIKAFKSLNDDKVSQHEVNNNSLTLNQDQRDNEVPPNLNCYSSSIVNGQNISISSSIFPESDGGTNTIPSTLEPATKNQINSHQISDNVSNSQLESNAGTRPKKDPVLDVVEKRTADMSGVLAKVSDQERRNLVDTQPARYRISASINSSNASKEATESVLENNSHLPSSVYGTSTSNIENVLTGLKVSENSQKQSSFLQDILEKKISNIVKNDPNCSGESEDRLIDVLEPRVGTESLALSTASKFSQNNDKNNSFSKLKLHMPDNPSNDDSNSSLASLDKNARFPKITSPQILEQHISKIISENAAIVETLDPMWSRRYFKQASQTSVQSDEGDGKKTNGQDEKSSLPNLSEIGCKSKLQSALLGNNQKYFPARCTEVPSNSMCFTQAVTVPSVSIYSKITCSATEEELKGTAIKSLLSLNKGSYTTSKKPFFLERDTYHQHPQNPEGSIIKDLLLQSKSQEDSKMEYSSSDIHSDTLESSDKDYLVYKCSQCSMTFSNKYNLEVHLSFCDAAKQLLSLRDSTGNARTFESNAQVRSFENPDNQYKVRRQTWSESSKRETAIEDGPILKKQLLMPKSPPMKRRKISDLVLTSFSAEPNTVNFMENKISNRLQLLNDTELPPAHRSRSHSVHLYGGEVQVLDGANTRKIKIKTSLPGAFSVVSTKSSSDSLKSKDEAAMRKDDFSFPSGVVNISQPVHNSGAIVHFPTTSIPNIVSCVTLSSSSISKYVKPLISFPKMSFDSEDSLTFSVQNETTSQTQKFSFLNSCLPDMHHIKSPCKMYTTNTKTTFSSKTPVTSSNKPFYSSILSTAEQSSADFDNPFKDAFRNNRILPTVLFTPSSPTRTCADDAPVSSATASESSKKFLAPTRPTSLPLKKKPFTMVSSTLVSPETPRPKKSCVQLYLNGHAYTYLGLKCSTRSTYCSIYRPQPMFVLQENNPKLSMYSNWQVVPAKEELSGLSPGQVIALYCSKHQKGSHGITVNATVGEPLILTHSSYWTYRSQDHIEEDKPLSEPIVEDALSSSQSVQDALVGENSQSESIISSTESKAEKIAQSTDDSNLCLEEIENTLSDADLNNSNDEEDCQDDGTESLTDSSQPKPPKRVKICEGGFKSNEDYTYVRGRGRGKYVCEECGIRCKKPSMLKKHIRTHTDLRPYKCRHCSFAFKTKGNLTKHMKSKAHHKKCTELGIDPVPTTTDDSQVDEEALAKQVEQFNKRKSHFSDDDEGDDDDEDEDSDESDDDCESDASSMISNTQQSKMLSNGHSKKSDSQEQITFEVTEDNIRANDSISQHALEQEAVRSLLNLSSLGEQTQWSNSTGDLTDVTSSGETDTNSLNIRRDQLLISPTAFSPHTVCTGMAPSLKSNTNTSDQWLSTETLGHRPRSYSADIPFSGGKEAVAKLKLVRGINIEGNPLTSPQEESNEFGVKEQYTRRYSISVARERRPRALNAFDWGKATSTSERWLEGGENADQPMDLSVTRDLSRCKAAYTIGMSGTLMNMVPTDDNGADLPVTLEVFGESYQLKTLPVLSPQILIDYETSCGVGSNTTEPSVLTMEEEPAVLKSTASTVAITRSSFYPQDASTSDANRKETETTEDPSSPDMADYSVNSPVSPSNLEDNAYYYPPEGATPTTSASAEDSSRSRAEFIVPTSSSSATNMEEGKCVCRICNKMFAKSSHLRLHVNIHYFERPFRCDNCAVSFRTKGHLQKHKRSVSHYNKVNMNMTFGTPTVDNPRPFKCGDCKIAFRIHGHLAKHLRSKMHIMKLECLGKLPFGMYAEMERSGISLNEIDTTDCNNSLESLQVMAQKLYQRDPRRMRWQGPEQPLDVPCTSSVTAGLIDSMLPITEPLVANFDAALSAPIALPAMHPTSDGEDVKQELSEAETLCIAASIYPDAESAIAGYVIPQTSSGQSDAGQRVEVLDTDSSLHRSGTCHICGRLFKSAKFLQVHLYCDHPTWSSSSATESLAPSTFVSSATNSQELACDLCGKQFPNQKVLQQHLLSHAQPRPFVCELCDAGFTSSSSLVAHKATHQNNSSVDRTSQSK